jgi:hypothetical protein
VSFGCGTSREVSAGTTVYVPYGLPTGIVDATGNPFSLLFSSLNSAQVTSLNNAGYKIFFCTTNNCNSVSSDFTSSSAVSVGCPVGAAATAALSGGAIGGIIAGAVVLLIALPLAICALCCGGIGVACARLAGGGKAPPIASSAAPAVFVGAPSPLPQFNPILQMAHFQSTWRTESDGADTWFVNTATGEVSWVLPPGGVVVP